MAVDNQNVEKYEELMRNEENLNDRKVEDFVLWKQNLNLLKIFDWELKVRTFEKDSWLLET